jgi:hypothetical protein
MFSSASSFLYAIKTRMQSSLLFLYAIGTSRATYLHLIEKKTKQKNNENRFGALRRKKNGTPEICMDFWAEP